MQHFSKLELGSLSSGQDLEDVNNVTVLSKVNREKARGEGSLIVQDTMENVSEPNIFFNFLRRKKKKLVSFYARNVFTV